MTWPRTLAGLPSAGSISKPHDYKQRTRNEGPYEKMSFNEEQFETFKSKNPITVWRTKQKNHKTPRGENEHEPCSQEETKSSRIDRSIHNKTVRTLQD